MQPEPQPDQAALRWARAKSMAESLLQEAPVRIELTNSRFAVCRLTTWPRRRGSNLSGRESPEQSRHEDTERQSRPQNQHEHDHRDRHQPEHVMPFLRSVTTHCKMTLQ
jgi:hypothetical protein